MNIQAKVELLALQSLSAKYSFSKRRHYFKAIGTLVMIFFLLVLEYSQMYQFLRMELYNFSLIDKTLNKLKNPKHFLSLSNDGCFP